MHSLTFIRETLPRNPVVMAPIKRIEQTDQYLPVLNKGLPNSDLFHTLNFLYQRAVCAANRNALCKNASALETPDTTMRHFFSLAKRAVIRVDPTIKHHVCRSCFWPLLEGLTSFTVIKGAMNEICSI